ncbi:MAG: hypothetical protein QNK19_01895 [Xanthomonadales bacterium]|nr:hypothetical protein [Xanthomonadales bacterium]
MSRIILDLALGAPRLAVAKRAVLLCARIEQNDDLTWHLKLTRLDHPVENRDISNQVAGFVDELEQSLKLSPDLWPLQERQFHSESNQDI